MLYNIPIKFTTTRCYLYLIFLRTNTKAKSSFRENLTEDYSNISFPNSSAGKIRFSGYLTMKKSNIGSSKRIFCVLYERDLFFYKNIHEFEKNPKKPITTRPIDMNGYNLLKLFTLFLMLNCLIA